MAEAVPTIESFYEAALPPQDSPLVPAALARRQEFAALASGPTEPQPPPGHYYKHQRFVVEFLKRYDRLLLVHDAGTGKTCSVGATAEYYKDLFVALRELPQQLALAQMPIKRAYVFVKGEPLAKQFGLEIATVCRPGVYITEREILDYNEAGQKHHVTKALRKWYGIETLQTFYNRHYRDSDAELAAEFSGCFFYLDEVHNLTFRPAANMEPPASPRWAEQRTEARSEEGKTLRPRDKLNIYHFFWRLFHVVDRAKVMVGSATPMSNVPEEIVPILNLVTPLELTLPYRIPPDGVLGAGYRERFERAATGRVSYFRALFTGAIPHYVGEPIPRGEGEATFTRVRLVKMGTNETRVYNQVVVDSRKRVGATVEEVAEGEAENEAASEASQASEASEASRGGQQASFYLRERQCSTFVYPPSSGGGLPTPQELRAQVAVGKKYNERWLRQLRVSGEQSHPALYEPTPELTAAVARDPLVCSAKFASIFDEILRTPDQLRFVYNEWVVGAGVGALGAYFMARGAMPVYLQAGQKSFFVSPPSQLSQRQTGRLYARPPRKRLSGFARLLYEGARNLSGGPVAFYFAVVTSGTASAERDAIFQLFSWSQNRRGRYLLVLIGSRQLGEGINLKNVFHVDIVNPTFDSREIYQAVRRVLRATSHVAVVEQRLALALEALELLEDLPRLRAFLEQHEFPRHTGLSGEELLGRLADAARISDPAARRRALLPLAYVQVAISLYGAYPDGEVVARRVAALLREGAAPGQIVAELGLAFLIDGLTTEEIRARLGEAQAHPAGSEARAAAEAGVAQELGDAAWSSAVDVAIYVRAEEKDRRLHEVLRRLKELAVDCALNYADNVRPTDVPGSPECDFMACGYDCGAAVTGAVPTSLSSPELEAAVEAFVRERLARASALTVGAVRAAFPALSEVQVHAALAAFLAREPPQRNMLGFGRQVYLEAPLIYLAAERGSSLDRLYSVESFLTQLVPLPALLAETRAPPPVEGFLSDPDLGRLQEELRRLSAVPLLPQRLLVALFERVAAELWGKGREHPITRPLMRALRWMYAVVNAPQGRPRSRSRKSEKAPKARLPKKLIPFDPAKPVVYVHFLNVLENESFSPLQANYTTLSNFKNADTPEGLRIFDPAQIDWGSEGEGEGSALSVLALLEGWRTAPPLDDRYAKALLSDTHRRYLDALAALETYAVYVPQFSRAGPKFLLADKLSAKMQHTERAFGKVCKPSEAAPEVVRILVHLHRLATLPVGLIAHLNRAGFGAHLARLQREQPALYRQLWEPLPPPEVARRRRVVRDWEVTVPGAPSAAEAIRALGYFPPPPDFALSAEEREHILARFRELPPGSPLRPEELGKLAVDPLSRDYDLVVAFELFEYVADLDFCLLVQRVFQEMGLVFSIIDW